MSATPKAVKANGIIYIVGKRVPKPMSLEDGTLKHGEDGVVAKIADTKGVLGIAFEDGDKFILTNMPVVYYYAEPADEPKDETAADTASAEA